MLADAPAPLPMPTETYVRRARPVRAIDGDTIQVELNSGWDTPTVAIRLTVRIRLLHVWCPEADGATRAEGLAAAAYTANWLAEALVGMADEPWPLVIQSEKGETFGRYLGTVWRRNDRACLNADLVTYGYGSYDKPPKPHGG